MLRRLLRRDRHEADLDDELEAWIAMAERRHLERGLDRRAARRAARLELGGKEQVKERVRAVWGGSRIDELLRDLRHGLRTLRAQPLFTAIAVLTLALGIGGNTAIFSLVHAVLVRPLPYPNPDRLALVWFGFGSSGQIRNPASGPELLDVRTRSKTFEDVAAIWSSTAALTGDGDPEQLRVGFVTANFFDVLGTRPVLGRGFVAEEEGYEPARGGALVLGDGVWRRRYGGDPAIIGRALELDGAAVPVVGVMPPGFALSFPSDAGVPRDIQAWIAFPWDVRASPRKLSFLRLLGRMKPGVTLAQARDDLAGIAADLRAEHARYHELDLEMTAVGLQQDAVRHLRPGLLALFGAVTLVLLIACVNVANLELGRLAARRREIALRAALGGGQGRIARQLLAESLALAAIGGVAGIGLGYATLALLATRMPAELAALTDVGLSWPVLAYTFGATLLAGTAFGLAPAIASARVALIDAMGAGRGGGPVRDRLRSALVVGELALGFLLLVGAGLLLRSLAHTLDSDPGFRAAGAVSFQVSLPRGRYPDDAARARVARRLRAELAAVPAVTSVGAASHLPLDDYPNWYGFVHLEGASGGDKTAVMADQRAVTPGYLEALGAELVAGRWLDRADRATSVPVAIVDTVLAERLWPAGTALGQGLHLEGWDNGRFAGRRVEVVGVVRHVHSHDLNIALRGQVYLPHSQNARPVLTWVLRTDGDPAAVVGSIAERVRTIDPALPLAKVRPLGFYFDQAAAAARFTTLVAAVFAGGAWLLAAIGVYGIAAHAVERRRHEIGVRLALGARARQILRAVVGRGLLAALLGLLLGLAGATLLGRVLEGLIHGVSPADPPTYAAVAALLLGAAAFAAYLPARRASRIDPLRCLRSD